MLIQLGVNSSNIHFVLAYIPATSLNDHLTNLKRNTPAYRRVTCVAKGSQQNLEEQTLQQILNYDTWDIISIQHASWDSYNMSMYGANFDEFVGLVKAAAPNAKLVWEMTWAYENTYAINYGTSQLNMYNGIVDCINKKIKTNPNFKNIIPIGAAIQYCRQSSVFGDMLCTDGNHLNRLGRYIASATWAAALTGLNINNLTTPYQISPDWEFSTGTTISQNDKDKIVPCVKKAVAEWSVKNDIK